MGRFTYGPLLGPERGRLLMDWIKYGPTFGPKHGNLLMGRPTSVIKIFWAFSWAGPLWAVESHGPLAGPAHYDLQKSCGTLPGPSHYGPQKSCGPLPRPAHYGLRNLVGL